MKQKGFTLIELLIVIAIIAILSTIGLISFSSASQKGRDARRTADVEQLRAALELFRSDCGNYPTATFSDLISDTLTVTCTNSSTNILFKAKYLGNKTVQDPQAAHTYTYTSSQPTSYTITYWSESLNASQTLYNP